MDEDQEHLLSEASTTSKVIGDDGRGGKPWVSVTYISLTDTPPFLRDFFVAIKVSSLIAVAPSPYYTFMLLASSFVYQSLYTADSSSQATKGRNVSRMNSLVNRTVPVSGKR